MRIVRHRRAGLTLFEVIVAVALMALLLSALLTFFWQTLEIREKAATVADETLIVQQMLDRIARDLRQCPGVQGISFPNLVQFSGDRRRLTFLTAPLPPEESYRFARESDEQLPPRHDLREVTYELWIDPEETTEEGDPVVGGILRTERRVLEPSEEEDEELNEDEDLLYMRRDLWSHELGYLEFRYYDGVEWATSWDVSQGNPLPHLVQITVGFDSLNADELEDRDLEEYPLDQYPVSMVAIDESPDPRRYSMIVRMPGADPMFTARLYRLGNEVEEVYEFMGAEAGDLMPEEGDLP